MKKRFVILAALLSTSIFAQDLEINPRVQAHYFEAYEVKDKKGNVKKEHRLYINSQVVYEGMSESDMRAYNRALITSQTKNQNIKISKHKKKNEFKITNVELEKDELKAELLSCQESQMMFMTGYSNGARGGWGYGYPSSGQVGQSLGIGGGFNIGL